LALRVLLIDPSNDWLETMAGYLRQHMYEVEVAQNGKKAQLAIYNKPFFAVVLNLSVKNHSGLEVLKFVRARNPGQRIVVILDNQEILKDGDLTIEKLVKMGATEVVIKPFEDSFIKDVLEGQQTIDDLVQNIPKPLSNEEKEVSESDSNFTSVRIDEFYSGKALLFDVYIRLTSNKYVKILYAGDTFSKDRLDKYKNEKKVEYLYFHNSDRRKYIQYCNYLTEKIVTSDKVSGNSKVKMMKSTADKLIEEVFAVGLKPQVVEEGKQLAQNMYTLVEKQPDLSKVLREYQDFDPSAYTHSFSVSLFTTAIIRQFEWQSRSMIETAAMACLFHDIGKMKLPKELITKKRSEMNQGELELYQKHPEYGQEILSGNIMINQNIRQIVGQHHEYFDGSGYPNKLKGNKVLTLANIISLADDFVHMVAELKLTPPEVLKKLLSNPDQIRKYNSLILEHFIKVFVDPGKVGKNFSLPSNSRIVPGRKLAS